MQLVQHYSTTACVLAHKANETYEVFSSKKALITKIELTYSNKTDEYL